MSSIASPKPTEAPTSARIAAAAGTLASAAILACLFITFTPFQSSFTGDSSAGSLINQLGYSALAAVALLGTVMLCERRVALSLVSPAWLLTLAWLGSAVFHAGDPVQTVRTLAFTLCAMLAAIGALTLPRDAHGFRMALAAGALAVLVLSLAGVVVAPTRAIHQAFGPEGQHAGLWRGVYSHKNMAGAMMGVCFFIGLYLSRMGHRLMGWTILALSLLFLFMTGSKTALALLPAVALMVVGGRMLGGRIVPVLVLAAALIVTALATLGSAMVPAINDVVQFFLPGTTFTGRLDLWRFALAELDHRQWFGYGFETFWRAGVIDTFEPSRELAWDPRGAVNAHNGYLDIAIALGWPGLALSVLVLAVLPMRDFLHTGRDRESARLADFFLMVLAYGLLSSFLETFLFERANPVWMSTWMAVAGLRLAARNGVRRAT